MKNTNIQAISLFSGAGGLDLGCLLNGIEIKVSMDFDNDSIETLKKAHSKEYINKIKNKTLDDLGQKKIGFPLNDSVVQRSFVATGGTVLASKLAIDFGLACNTAGGSHHASFDQGAGYCVFNDVAVATRYLQNKGYAKRILILDLDVHQGNGTADIFKNDSEVFTFSMHCKSNYPAKKSISDIDVELKLPVAQVIKVTNGVM